MFYNKRKYRQKNESGKIINNILGLLFVLLLLGILVFLIYLMFGEGRKYLDNFPNALTQTNEQLQVADNPIQSPDNVNLSDGSTVYPNIDNNITDNTNSINTDKYFYNQLSTQAKDIYNLIENNEEKLKRNEKIEFPKSITKNINSIEDVGFSFQSAWDALNLDRQDFFYIDTDKLSLSTKTITFIGQKSYEVVIEPKNGSYYTNQISSYEDLNAKIGQMKQVTSQIIDSAPTGNRAIIKHIHDWIVDNVSYDKSDDNQKNANIYGTLVVKNTVCKGYADTFKYLLDNFNIPNVIIYGDAFSDNGDKESHAWNYVQMEDGHWYAIDVTWDDPIIYGNGKLTDKEKYRYYLKGSNSFFTNHAQEGNVSGVGQVFLYPTINTADY